MRNDMLNEMQLEGACFMECAAEDNRDILINLTNFGIKLLEEL